MIQKYKEKSRKSRRKWLKNSKKKAENRNILFRKKQSRQVCRKQIKKKMIQDRNR